jgi:hypothetical protein
MKGAQAMSNPADLSFQEREAALQTARSILETAQYGVLELNLQRLCWSGESMVLLARAAALYCTQGPSVVVPPSSLPGVAATVAPLPYLPAPTQQMSPPTPTQMMPAPTALRGTTSAADDRTAPIVRAAGSGRMEIELPPGHVLGVIEAETSDGVPLAPADDAVVEDADDAPTSAIVDEADDAKTGAVIDHTQPVMVDGKLSVVKRSVGFPIDGAGGHSRSGEM